MLYAYMVAILLVLTTVSTYAWFSLTATPRVSNLSIFVNTFPGMEITTDPESGEWKQQISYEELFSENYKIRPATWSQKDGCFYGATYSIDGKLKDQWQKLTDDRHSNNTTLENYYCIATFYARAGSGIKVSLAPALAINEGLAASGTYLMGEPTWNEETVLHDNSGKGAENAIRIGINITRLNEDHTPKEGPADFYIYEPNADTHNDGTMGYVDTPSKDGDATLVESEKILRQSASAWSETDPVQRDVLVHRMGEFDGSTELFEMAENEVVRIQLIIWLEGQDIDCTNAISDARIIANLQFNVEPIGDSGLVPIPKETDEP